MNWQKILLVLGAIGVIIFVAVAVYSWYPYQYSIVYVDSNPGIVTYVAVYPWKANMVKRDIEDVGEFSYRDIAPAPIFFRDHVGRTLCEKYAHPYKQVQFIYRDLILFCENGGEYDGWAKG